MKPQTKTYKHVIDLYFESVPHSIRTFSVHGNTLIYIEYEEMNVRKLPINRFYV